MNSEMSKQDTMNPSQSKTSSRSLGEKLIKGTMAVVSASALAKILAFISDAVFAAYLGTSAESDAYYMVSGIMYMIYPILSCGIWNVFLPVYQDHLVRYGEERAGILADRGITLFGMISLALSLVIFGASGAVAYAAAPGFDRATHELCSHLVRISAPMYFFLASSALYSTMLQCHNKFFASQLTKLVAPIPSILTLVFFYPRYGMDALAYALIIAGVFRLLVQLPFVDWGYHYRPKFERSSSETLTMLRRLPAVLLSEGVHSINLLVDKMMASTLAAGAISSLNYASKLINVFSGLLSSAVSTALFPQIVKMASEKKRKELSQLLTKILSIYILMMVPVMVACGLFAQPLVTAVYARGKFMGESVSMTSGIFIFYSFSLFFTAGSSVLTSVFYSHGDTRTPMFFSLINLGLNTVLNLILMNLLGAKGLALASSLSALQLFALRVRSAGKYIDLDLRYISRVFGKVILISLVACLIPFLICLLLEWNVYIELFLAASIGVTVYAVLIFHMGIEEVGMLKNLVLKKLKRK